MSDFIDQTKAIGDLGGAPWYFDAKTLAAGKEHNLDGFRFYFLGRGGVLGDVEAEVVAERVRLLQPGARRRRCGPRPRSAWRRATRPGCTCRAATSSRRDHFGAVDGLDAVLRRRREGQRRHQPGRPGAVRRHRQRAAPRRPPARALHLTAVLREARGSAHLLAIVASGLPPRIAHAIKRPTEGKEFGWDDTPEPTADDRARWQQAEELTDRLLGPAFDVLDDGGAGRAGQGPRRR